VSVQDATVKRILTEENDERAMMNDERSEAFPSFIIHHSSFIISV
jgi:hypothetical protein